MKLGFVLPIVTMLMAAGPTAALADDQFLGKWHDNSPQRRPMGTLEITTDKIKLGKVTYDVVPKGPFGNGILYAVKDLTPKPDPRPCGASDPATYFIVKPLPPDPIVPQATILVIFYSGANAPRPETLDSDVGVCGQHPFGRSK
ncbi:hypothetical protein [Nitrospirillum amazonense]|uniref:DUF2147 domain-containing protein n=1 Tax=Nitrospirillum amazonense TaxID=28077 RepID=A0A560KHI3_9PROT|nr:hypothetical protein [Nitrospirillum amazonense]MDG3441419.1 hypothetical protein [Nitrospirillum amazonense]TWB80090.1 hypothetical protein FBZ87_102514 [Nitrospirillum amazonense]